ncbi:MAG TPA: hypothetical protein VEA38_17640 [Terriglobales bacterium]|nr:hypothetical protein [Terriglobales bacterium]
MKKLMTLAAAIAIVAVAGSPAYAFKCPTMIKEGKEAAAKMKADDPKVKTATAKLDEAQKLHGEGKHADSVKAAEEAHAMLGIKK